MIIYKLHPRFKCVYLQTCYSDCIFTVTMYLIFYCFFSFILIIPSLILSLPQTLFLFLLHLHLHLHLPHSLSLPLNSSKQDKVGQLATTIQPPNLSQKFQQNHQVPKPKREPKVKRFWWWLVVVDWLNPWCLAMVVQARWNSGLESLREKRFDLFRFWPLWWLCELQPWTCRFGFVIVNREEC